MTGIQGFRFARAELAKAGLPPSRLSPDVYMDLVSRSMLDLNDKAAIYVARDISFTITTTTGRFVRLQVDGKPVPVLAILRASYHEASSRGYSVRIEPPFQDTGQDASGATVGTGPPEHVWVEADDYSGPFVTPVAPNQVWGFYPTPDDDYTIHAVCKMIVPDYDNWLAALPVQVRAHKVVVDDVLGRLFSTRDFHDNAMKVFYLRRTLEGVMQLQRGDQKWVAEPAALAMDEGDWRQEE